MPVFEYQTRDAEGLTTANTIEARDRTAAILALRDRGVFTADVRMVRVRTEAEAAEAAARRSRFRELFFDPIFFRVSRQKLSFVFHELASATNAGVPLSEALDMVAHNLRPRYFQQVIVGLQDAVRNGRPLAPEMRKSPTIFNELMVALVAAGERSGDLPGMFRTIADWLDYETMIRTRMFTATLYPKIVAVVAVVVAVILPAASAIAHNLLLLGVICSLVPLACVGAWFFYKGAERWMEQFAGWRRGWDKIKIGVPIIGAMMRKFAIARFCNTLAMLFRSGILLHTCLDVAADSCGNVALADSLKRAVPDVMGGKPLADALRATGQVPYNVLHMIATGEKTGDLDSLLQNVAKVMTEEADATAQRMVPILFVATFLIMAIVVGYMYISFWVGHYGGLLSSAGE